MASGFVSGTTDLDSIFAPYTTGTKPAATGYIVGTQDLKDRYAPLSTGSAAAATGFNIAGGADLNTLFAAIGTTASVSIADRTILVDATPPADAVATYSLNSDGTNGFGGEWLTGGTASNYEVQAVQFSDDTVGTGTSVSGTLNTYMNLGTTRSWSASATNNGANTSRTWVLDLTIRRVSDSVVMDTARITLQATTTLA